MLPISGSPNLTSLDFAVLFDLTSVVPAITLTNQSAGGSLAGCSWWYVITTPSGSFIHNGNSTSPDASGVWATINVPTSGNLWPQPFGQIEYNSFAPYSVTLFVKDSANSVFSLTKTAIIVRPSGCQSGTKANFGAAQVVVTVRCENGKLTAEDQTSYSYNGILPAVIYQQYNLIFPPDDTGTIPSPVIVNGVPTALFDLAFSAPGYQMIFNSVMLYSYPDSISVKIKYKFRNEFAVQCDVDLCPLVCSFNQMLQDSQNGDCTDKAALDDKIVQISGLLIQAMIGKTQPLCGIDVAAIVAQIKQIGGFDCTCSSQFGSGMGSSAPAGDIGVTVNGICGDVSGEAEVTGSNIVINLKDVSYDFKMSDDSDLENAFEISSEIDATTCKKTYSLKVTAASLPGGCCPENVQVVVKGTETAPATCPNSYFPVELWTPSATNSLGTVNDINEMISAMNANTGANSWGDMGIWIASGFCRVVLFRRTGFVGNIPHIPVSDPQTAGCVNNQQAYIAPLQNYNNTSGIYTPVAYPFNAYVRFTPGGPRTLLPNITAYGDIVTQIYHLGTPPKPTNISVNPVANQLGVQVIDTDCSVGSVVSIEVDSFNQVLYGAANNNGQGLVSGVVGIDTLNEVQLPFVCGTKGEQMPWHMVKYGDFLYTIESNTGKFWKIDVSNPMYPVIAKTVAFPAVSAAPNAAFSGFPKYNGLNPSNYDTYFPTDLNSEVSGFLYIVESSSGCIWKYNLITDTVDASDYNIGLVGRCPRFVRGNYLYFSCDGSRESDLGISSGISKYKVVKLDLTTIGSGSLALDFTLGFTNFGPDEVWSLSYDPGSDTLWASTLNGNLHSFNMTTGVVAGYAGLWGVSGTFAGLLNTHIFNNMIYASNSEGLGTRVIDLALLHPAVVFDSFAVSTVTKSKHFNFYAFPGKSYGIVSYNNGITSGTHGGLAKFTLDGHFISNIPFTSAGNVYNVIALLNASMATPNGLCP